MTSCTCVSTIVYILLLSTTYSDKSHDDIVTVWIYGVISQCDAWGRSRLSFNGGVCTDVDVTFQGNYATHIEYDNLFGRATHSLSERACTRIVEIGYVDNVSATSSGSISTVSFRSRESRGLRLGKKTDEQRE